MEIIIEITRILNFKKYFLLEGSLFLLGKRIFRVEETIFFSSF